MDEKKKLGLPSAVAACIGLVVATSCLLSLCTGAGLAGDKFILAMAIVVVYNLCMTISFRELNGMMPNIEGGFGQYTKIGLGPVLSIVSNGSAYFFVNLFGQVVENALCGAVVSSVLLPNVPPAYIGICFVVVLTTVNYFGVDIFAKVQNVAVGLLIVSLFLMGILSTFKLGTGEVLTPEQAGTPPVAGLGAVVGLSALAFWLFIGVEFVVPLSPSIKNPRRNVGIAMTIALFVILAYNALLGHGMVNYVSYEELTTDGLPHLLFAERLMGHTGVVWMAVVSILASVSTGNTVFNGVPTILAGMAKNRMVPRAFERKNRYGTPVLGLFLISGLVILLLALGLADSAGLVNLLLAASCFWILSYLLVSITVLVLRSRYPKHPGRDNRFRLAGIPQLFCIVLSVYMVWNIAEGDDRIIIYRLFGILGACLVAYAVVWVGLVQKQPLFKGSTIDDAMESENYSRMLEEKRRGK